MSAPELSASIKPCDTVCEENDANETAETMYLCAGLGNGTKVVDHVSLGHANAAVTDGEDLIFFIWDDPNE